MGDVRDGTSYTAAARPATDAAAGVDEARPFAHALHRLLSARGSVAFEDVPGIGEQLRSEPAAAAEGRVSAGSLAGVAVVNVRGDELGRVADLVIEMERGCVVEAVVAVGGILGIGGRQVGVAWDALAYDPARNRLELDTDSRALEDPPGEAPR
jgi:sporulation protein YlmC with PRC-barrel domain